MRVEPPVFLPLDRESAGRRVSQRPQNALQCIHVAELPENFLYIEYDQEIVDLEASNAGDCMRGVMRSLADDPPEGPATIRLGGPQSQPSDMATRIVAATVALRRPAAACAVARRIVRLDLTLEPKRGEIVQAQVHQSQGTPDEACIVDAARGLRLGPTGSGDPSYLSLILGLGPTPPPLAQRPELSARSTQERARAVRTFFKFTREALRGCSDEPVYVEFQIAYEGKAGEVVDVQVVTPADHPREACIVDALMGHTLGPFEQSDRGSARFVAQLGPRPGAR